MFTKRNTLGLLVLGSLIFGSAEARGQGLQLDASPFITGTNAIVSTTQGEVGWCYILMFDWQTGNILLPGGSRLELGFSSGFRVLDIDVFDRQRAIHVLMFVPQDDIWALGMTFHLQSASLDPGTGLFRTSNRLEGRLEEAAPEFAPAWAGAPSSRVIEHSWDTNRSQSGNGEDLAAAIRGLEPGTTLVVEEGTYVVDQRFDIALQGTANAPIRIVAAPGARPVITRSNASQNVINMGDASATRFLVLRGFEIRGGSAGIKMYECNNVWIRDCEIHHTGDAGIAANSGPTEQIFITDNEIHDTSGYGEGMYLGANHGTHIMRYSVIARNHVYDTGGLQGDGIELKQGSYGNLIAENYVHDTNYPCILVYGTDGRAVNLIEGNTCIGSNDNVMQVQGEAIVRNNLLMRGGTGFSSHDHQGSSKNLVVTHNTIINEGRGTYLRDWNGRQGMVFANNVVYSRDEASLVFPGGSANVTVSGNVVRGGVVGVSSGFTAGSGLSDFRDVTWSGEQHDASPTPGGSIIASGDPTHLTPLDATGTTRISPPVEAGAYDGQ